MAMVYSGISKSDFQNYRRMVTQPWFGRRKDAEPIRPWRHYRELVTLLPVVKLYIKNYHVMGLNDTVTTHKYGFHSLFDILTQLFQYGHNLNEMQFLPRVGDYISEMWHGRVCRDSPLFTSPTITVGGVEYALAQYVRYSVEGDPEKYVGRVISIFQKDATGESERGLTTSSARTIDDVCCEQLTGSQHYLVSCAGTLACPPETVSTPAWQAMIGISCRCGAMRTN